MPYMDTHSLRPHKHTHANTLLNLKRIHAGKLALKAELSAFNVLYDIWARYSCVYHPSSGIIATFLNEIVAKQTAINYAVKSLN